MNINLKKIIEEENLKPRKSSLAFLKSQILTSLNDGHAQIDLWRILKKRELINCTYRNFTKQVKLWKTQDDSISQIDIRQEKIEVPYETKQSISADNIQQPKKVQNITLNDEYKPRISSFRTRTGEAASDEDLY